MNRKFIQQIPDKNVIVTVKYG